MGAVAQDGHVLDILVQRRRDSVAAQTRFRQLLQGLTYMPRVMVPDKLKSDGAATQEMAPSVEQWQQRHLHSQAEHSHHPTRNGSSLLASQDNFGRTWEGGKVRVESICSSLGAALVSI